MNRREFVAWLGLGAAIGPICASAQGVGTPRRIAFVGVTPADAEVTRRILSDFREGLAGEGFAEGRKLAIDFIAEADIAKVPERVAELLRRKPEVLVAVTTPVALAAARATRDTPIVFSTVSDPVGSGLVASLARPGGNVTGVSNMLPELSGKLLELVREIIPGVGRVAVLWNPDNPAKAMELRELRAAGPGGKIALQELPARSGQEIERAVSGLGKDGARALVILGETLTFTHRRKIAELALANRMPVISNNTAHTDVGGLASYSPDYRLLNRRLGALAAKILSGAKPADLPVELPTKFELVVNRKTAKVLGLKIPPSILLRADRVIE